ncbi:SAM-dependent methyltransferase [Lacrimispora sp. 210928-DFI.3.58]|uniref:SAM-dependent methyltransferase n=1 Tax=Lacrimispora sp. 210928-DFI.3.58 TaxID=2883214 RepID=UPI001D0860A6|nr:SAM-dependent methyltransferase [Lacrimispora sp. 210928-DFI.3.58]MCB7321038.1 SAM-dependent methyltransferase [Lacrimispora sp. 210928-DFI.3.58]
MIAEKERQWDKLLRIKTTGRDDSKADQYHYPYGPTPYVVLERLAGSGYIGKRNLLMDCGCGKGRVDFYLSYQIRCRTIGIEYDERMYGAAVENQKTAVSAGKTRFQLSDAVDCEIDKETDRFYFFNPFSEEILHKVVTRIIDSYYENPRECILFAYYPSHEYISCLMRQDSLLLADEIDCRDLFPGNDPREKILVFKFV